MPFVDTNSPLMTKHPILTSSITAIMKAMTNRFFWDQVLGGSELDSRKEDFCGLVRKYLEELKIDISDEEI